ncbi:Adenosine deaminase, putative [Perkinsus marinus ATCC 50983]|uniref:Adenosine deaminase n=1 Tax=Perkinsus marinus (strain ATCC 50983 / TXsc) TaxID=423536 RepID=C5LJ94_PERM5|nr:Adenosine deaminase, putative [Perkinsus marinus ATCC 50983]EER03210.1 Adenosine deaminase, putative [Perkinsus marinus ATCC 50983]|eukprot:XP_002771394.1 Adenosine deaminase, putative [Perkinsus marinus ATCC 50983]
MSNSYNFFYSAPKVELHIHFDGAFDMDFLYQIAKRDLDQLPESVPAPWNGPDATVTVRSAIAACKCKEDFEKITCLGPETVVAKRLQNGGQKGAGLACMLDCFAVFTPVVQGKRDVIEEMAFKVCERQYRENVVYTELRYNPHVLTKEGSSLPDARSVVEAVTAGIEHGKEVFGIDMNQILCCMNLMPEVSDEVADLAIEFKSKGVVAIDVAAGETHFENEDLKKAHVAACLKAEKAGLRVTVHGAEDGSSTNFCCAVREYHAERVGHAYKIAADSAMYKMAEETHTHIEACPTSSICTEAVCLPQVHPEKPILDSLDWNKHPIKKFIEDGLSVSISTDDPTVFLTHITDELTILADRFGFDAHKVGLAVTMNAIDSCWASVKEKSHYREVTLKYYEGEASTVEENSD